MTTGLWEPIPAATSSSPVPRPAEPTMMASSLYLGAGIGLFLFGIVEKLIGKGGKKEPLTKKELPYTIAMVILDIVAPILLMLGIARTNSANVSLLNNFEIVATALIAFIICLFCSLFLLVFFIILSLVFYQYCENHQQCYNRKNDRQKFFCHFSFPPVLIRFIFLNNVYNL